MGWANEGDLKAEEEREKVGTVHKVAEDVTDYGWRWTLDTAMKR